MVAHLSNELCTLLPDVFCDIAFVIQTQIIENKNQNKSNQQYKSQMHKMTFDYIVE